jgi:hypothetical protein
MTTPISELAWNLTDYKVAGVEPPARCVSNPDRTEGEMMTPEEVEEFVKDSIATLRILSDKQSNQLGRLTNVYLADLAYLKKVGSLGEDDYNELVHPDNLHF